MTEKKIILYSNHCPKCNILASKLKVNKIEYEEVSDINVMIKLGMNTMPVLEINGEKLDFIDANNWINERTK